MSSSVLFDESQRYFPGGVNSPVRYYRPNPVFIKKGKGSRIFDADGKQYIDYCLGYGPMILGHANEKFSESLKARIEDGILFGSPTEEENILASKIREAIPSVEKMRFTNSGTEATMHAIRLARAHTKRKIILKMEGGYHGAHDYSLIKAGSGSLTFGTPSSPGVPEEISRTVVLGEYNNIDSIRKIFSEMGDQIAAVITEPVMGNVGVVPPKEGFLQELREICDRNSSLLILDEVITGFRFGYHGYQDLANLKPDLTTLGKIIGGGLPIGLFGGRADIMDEISPSGKVYEAGTFSGNPVSVSGGIATLDVLRNSDYSHLTGLTEKLAAGISDIAERAGEDVQINQIGPMFQVFFNSRKVSKYADAISSNSERFFEIFTRALQEGIYMPPSQFETNFLSFAHSESDIEETISAFEQIWN
ncbi:glutamate-1-semialdehyde aminotransferase [uncultured archaeon]|nr:glutamate-1-semialdehyde aminotransferase [uncultured archaeon]HKJ96824.1 glutamate-1-semialdehyde 2,1-aminomutase [Thermoplasmataceae archaeon]